MKHSNRIKKNEKNHYFYLVDFWEMTQEKKTEWALIARGKKISEKSIPDNLSISKFHLHFLVSSHVK